MPKFLTIRDISKILRLPEAKVVKFCEEGTIPAENHDGVWVIWESDLEECQGPEPHGLPPFAPPDGDDPFV